MRRLGWAIACAVLLLDQATKIWAISALSDGHRVQAIPGLLHFTYVRNSGAAFSMGQGSTLYLALFSLLVGVAIALFGGRSKELWLPMSLILGGILGNLSDRIFRSPGGMKGHVVDWIELPHWPIFNIADSAVVIAASIIVISALFQRKRTDA
ncbi:MAG: signal peptidase II [Actinobacteria bacterium]|nr:signal peptidase II [Actinomycetota bacterium]MTB25328.1 signal peptidase II [Actinomycetota bacterium]